MRRFIVLIGFTLVLTFVLSADPPHQGPDKTGHCIYVQNASTAIYGTISMCKIKNPVQDARGYKLQTVVIDPGHGGKDPGCQGANSREKEIVLKLGLRLGSLLKEQYPELEVIYTRTEDDFIPLHKRAKIANQADADLFISLHCNYVGRSDVHGSETYVLGLHRADDNLRVAKRENAAILLEENYKSRYDGYDPNSSMSHIILSTYQSAHLDQSIRFAEEVEEAFKRDANRSSRGVKQAGFLVLRQTTMPSVLIESGFLSHRREESFLLSEAGQAKMSRAIFTAFKEYKKEYESQEAEKYRERIASDDSAYFVQLAVTSSKTAEGASVWKGVPRLNYIEVGKLYKYLSGPYSNRQDAEHWKSRLAEKGFEDAFITQLEGSSLEQLAQIR